MAVTQAPAMRAIALFNLTGQEPGFLQPIFAGPSGDNQVYVQHLVTPGRVSGFEAVSWPQGDWSMLEIETAVDGEGESLWAFALPGEEPVVLPWEQFRTWMRGNVNHPSLEDRPLLQFDIVDTLDLDEHKTHIFGRAFRAYQRSGNQAAERWRDRAILEPALAAALGETLKVRPDADYFKQGLLRARIERDRLFVELALPFERSIEAQLMAAYDRLAEEHHSVFPRVSGIDLRPRLDIPRHGDATPPLTVVLIGRLREGAVDHQYWKARGIDVIDHADIAGHFNARQIAPLVVLLVAQGDWKQLLEVDKFFADQDAISIVLTTSSATVVRDLDFQRQASLPSITVFAPFATAVTRRDPLKPAATVLALLQQHWHEERSIDSTLLPAMHSRFTRERFAPDHDPVEIVCRLGARALRAGTRPGGGARLLGQGNVPPRTILDARRLLSRLFDTSSPRGNEIVEGRPYALLLLSERPSGFDFDLKERMQAGFERLFEMRGWTVKRDPGGATLLTDGQREFGVTIIDQAREIPTSNRAFPAPAFTRAPLLVLHASPRREVLLQANRGCYFHIAPEDIALMRPGSLWVWPILRRQLLEWSKDPSDAAVQLCGSLAAEAIRTGRTDGSRSVGRNDLAALAETLESSDFPQYVDFTPSRFDRNGIWLLCRLTPYRIGNLDPGFEMVLQIADDGPTITFV